MKRLLSRSGFTYLDNFFRLGASALVSFVLAKALGPESFGILNYSTALTALFLAGAAFGLENPIILRLVGNKPVGEVLGTAMAIRLVSSLCCVLIGIALVWQLQGYKTDQVFWVNVIQLFSLLVFIPGISELWFRSRTDTLWPAMVRSSAVAVSSAMKLVLVFTGASLLWYAGSVLVEAAITSFGMFLLFRHFCAPKQTGLTVNRKELRPMAKDALPFVISAFSVIVYMKIDAVMLGNMVGHHENGIYAVSQKFTEILYIVPVVLADTFYPTLIKKYQDHPKDFDALFQGFMDGVIVVSLLVIVVSIVLAGPVIEWVFGDKYLESITIFKINAWACIPVTLAYVRSKWLAIKGLQRYESWATMTGAGTNIALNLYLIPRWGAHGAAAASLVAYCVAGVLTSLLLPGTRKVGRQQLKALWPFGRVLRLYKDHYRTKVNA